MSFKIDISLAERDTRRNNFVVILNNKIIFKSDYQDECERFIQGFNYAVSYLNPKPGEK